MRKKSGLKERVCNWLKGRFRRVLFAAGIVAGWGCKMLQAGQVYAAEALQVTELCVVRDEDGICASCTYRDPDGDSSILQLYLEKMDEQGSLFSPCLCGSGKNRGRNKNSQDAERSGPAGDIQSGDPTAKRRRDAGCQVPGFGFL